MTRQTDQSWFASYWHLLVPTTLLTALFLYLLLPGSILKNIAPTVLENLIHEKAVLENQLRALQDVDQNSVCFDDQLVIPKRNESSLLPPTNPNNLLAKLERSVVLVLVLFGENYGIGLGSGFFISPSQIVTNGHVITDEKNRPDAIYVVNKHIGIQEVQVDTLRYDKDFSEDFAVLSIGANIGDALQLAKITDPVTEKLRKVYAAGFPSDVIESDEKFLRLMESDQFSVPDLVITDGTISSHQNVFGAVSAFVHTAQISKGNSGGPLVNECGHVMGVNTFFVSNEGGVRNFSLSTTELAKHLRQNGFRTQLAAKECN